MLRSCERWRGVGNRCGHRTREKAAGLDVSQVRMVVSFTAL